MDQGGKPKNVLPGSCLQLNPETGDPSPEASEPYAPRPRQKPGYLLRPGHLNHVLQSQKSGAPATILHRGFPSSCRNNKKNSNTHIVGFAAAIHGSSNDADEDEDAADDDDDDDHNKNADSHSQKNRIG